MASDKRVSKRTGQVGEVRRSRLRPRPLVVATAVALLPWAGQLLALPTGEKTLFGNVDYSRPNSRTMNINVTTPSGGSSFSSFSIDSGQTVNIQQLSAGSTHLIKDVGGMASQIYGVLNANGQVFMSNTSGVFFARGAEVNVGALFATSLNINPVDFAAGRYTFYRDGGAGPVTNEGRITASAYAALAGPKVRNDGVIVARAGTVALAAGDRVSLDMIGDGLIRVSVDQAALNAAAINTGRIEADGGNVILTARSANALLDTVVNNSGVIRANSLVERNGEIVLDGGSAGVVANSGTLTVAGIDAGMKGGTITVRGDKVGIAGVVDASGDAGGGYVAIGRGANVTVIEAGATIRADATREGQGGYVETSGAHLQVSSAPQVGAGGTWLIDPYNIEIVDGASSSSNTGPMSFTPNGDNSRIGAQLIVDQLNAGTNVTIDTGGAGSPGTQTGDIVVNAAIEKTLANPASLALKALHDVQVNRPITIASSGAFHPLAIDAGNEVLIAAPISIPGGGLVITAGSFTNLSAINNGVGPDLRAGMAISADAFNLAGGSINGGLGSVGLFGRTPGKS